MNGGKIQYSVGFNVDKTSLNGILTSLQQIKAMSSQDFLRMNPGQFANANAELNKVKASAGQLELALKKAFNTNLGTLNIIKFRQELSKLNLGKIQADMAKVGASGTFRNLTTQVLTTNMQLKQTHTLMNKLSKTMGNTIKWGASSALMRGFTNGVHQAIGYVKNLDRSLNDIRIVTGKSSDEMARFAKEANKAAKNLGQTTTNYTDAALIYYQQGLSTKETQARAETTLKAANVTGQTGEEVSEQLTAVWNGYKVSAAETELYIDKLAAVAATTASDLEELSTGMSKVASAANVAGVDIDQLNATLSTVISVTRQAPETVGTAFKTIYARMGDLAVDGVDEFGTTLGSVSSKMKTMGIDVVDQSGNLRNMGTIVEEVAAKWDTWTEAQKQAAAVAMAGKRQYNNLIALFDNWDMYEDSLLTSATAAGTLQRQQDIYMESTQAHLKQLKASTEDLYDSLLTSEGINSIADGLKVVVDLMRNFVDSIGGGLPLLMSLGTIGMKVFSQQLASGLATFVMNMRGAQENMRIMQAEAAVLSQFKTAGIANADTQKLIGMKAELLALDKTLTAEEKNQGTEQMKQLNTLMEQKAIIQSNLAAMQQLHQAATGKQANFSTEQGREQAAFNLRQEDTYLAGRQKELARWNTQQISQTYQSQRSQGTHNSADAKAYVNSIKQQMQMAQQLLETDRLSGAAKDDLRQKLEALNKVTKNGNSIGLKKAQVNTACLNLEQSLTTALQTQRGALQGAASEIDKQVMALERCNAALQTAEQAWQKWLSAMQLRHAIQQTINLAAGIGQVAMGLNMVSNLGNVLQDDSLSGWQKLLQITTNLGFALPMIASGFSAMSTALQSTATGTALLAGAQTILAGSGSLLEIGNKKLLITMEQRMAIEQAKKALIEKGIAEETALALATQMTVGTETQKAAATGAYNMVLTEEISKTTAQSIANEALASTNTHVTVTAITAKQALSAMWTSIPVIGKVLLALAVAGAAIFGIVKLVQKIQNKETNALKDKVEALNQANEQYEKTKQLVSDINDKLANWKTATEDLRELTKGTAEWNQKLIEANNYILDLLDTYPELAKYISTDSNGMLVLSGAGQQYVANATEEQLGVVTTTRMAAQVGVLEAEQDVITAGKDITLAPDTTISNKGLEWAIQEGIENGLDFLAVETAEEIYKAAKGKVSYTDAQGIFANKTQIGGEVAKYQANEVAIDTYYDNIAAANLANDEYLNAIENESDRELVRQAYAKEWKDTYDQLLTEYEDKTDEEIQQAYADSQNATTYRKGEEKGVTEYYIGDEWIPVEDAYARQALAANDASSQLEFFTSNVYAAGEGLLWFKNQLLADNPGLSEEGSGVIAGWTPGTELDISNLPQVEQKYIRDLIENGKIIVTQEQLEQWGVDTQEEAIALLKNGLKKYDKRIKAEQDTRTEHGKAAMQGHMDNILGPDDKTPKPAKDEPYTPTKPYVEFEYKDTNGKTKTYIDYDAPTTQPTDEYVGSYIGADGQRYGVKADGSHVLLDTETGTAQPTQAPPPEAKDIVKKGWGRNGAYNAINWDQIWGPNNYEDSPFTEEDVVNAIDWTKFNPEDFVDKDGKFKQKEADAWVQQEAQLAHDEMVQEDEIRGRGQDVAEVEELANNWMEIADTSAEVSDTLDEHEQIAKEVASRQLKYNEALKKGVQLQEDYGDVLDDNDRTSEKWLAAQNGFNDVLVETYNLAEGTELSSEILGDPNTWALYKKYLEGDYAAFHDLADIIRKTTEEYKGLSGEQQKAVDTGMDFIDTQLADHNFTIGATFNELGITNEVQSWLDKGVPPLEVEAMLDTEGLDLQYQWVDFPDGSVQYNQDGTVTLPTLTEDGDVTTETVPLTAQVKSRIDNGGYYKVVGGKSSYSGAPGKGSSSGGGGGGGGGGGSTPKKTYKHTEKKRDRYRKVNNQLTELTTQLERLNTAQEHLFGDKLLKNLKEQLTVLQKQAKVTKEKLNLAKAEAEEMRKSIKNQEPGVYNDLLDFGIQFNADGTIKNYNKIMTDWDDKIQEMHDYWNSKSAKWQESEAGKKYDEKIKKAEENRDTLQELVEEYDTLIYETIPGLVDELTQIAYDQISIRFEAFHIEADLKLDLTEAYNDWAEFQEELAEFEFPDDLAASTEPLVDAIDYINNAGLGDTYVKNLETFAKLWEAYDNGDFSDRTFLATNADGTLMRDANGNVIFDENAFKEASEEEMQAAMDYILEQEERIQQVHDNYIESIERVGEAYEEELEVLEYIGDQLEHNLNMIQLMKGETAYEDMAAYYEERKNNLANTLMKQEESIAYYKQQMEEATDEEAKETWRQLYLEALATYEETLEATAEVIQAEFENAVLLQLEEFDKALGSAQFGTRIIKTKWEIDTQNAEKYLDVVEKTYGLQTLTNKINKSITETDSISAQKRLNGLLNDELKKLREKDKLTQYDLDRANAMYELELKKIALEEAQNNKAQMRLRRDASGNYSYQFVADQESIADAEQEVLDAQNNLYSMDKEELQNRQAELWDTYQEYQDLMIEYSQLSAAERERYEDEYALKFANLQQRMVDLGAECSDIQVNLAESASMAMTAAYDLMGEEMNYTLEEIVPAWASGMDEMIDKINGPDNSFRTAMENMFQSVIRASDVAAAEMATLGQASASAMKEAEAAAQDWKTAAEATTATEKEQAKTLKDLNTKAQAYKQTWEGIKNRLKQALSVMQNILTTQLKINAAQTSSSNTTRTSTSTTTTTTQTSGNDNNDNTGNDTSGHSFGSDPPPSTETKDDKPWWSWVTGVTGTKYGTDFSYYDTGGYTGDWHSDEGRLAVLHQKELVLNAKDTANILKTVQLLNDQHIWQTVANTMHEAKPQHMNDVQLQTQLSGIQNLQLDRMIENLSTQLVQGINRLAISLEPVGTNIKDLTNEKKSDIINIGINADFPNANSAKEIEQAFMQLTNIATQRAYSNKR
jgi:TP901 family phage tail tape measure protein